MKCPFCNGDAKIFAYSDGGICVKCMSCYCQTQATSDYSIDECKRHNAAEKVIKKWNRRYQKPEVTTVVSTRLIDPNGNEAPCCNDCGQLLDPVWTYCPACGKEIDWKDSGWRDDDG